MMKYQMEMPRTQLMMETRYLSSGPNRSSELQMSNDTILSPAFLTWFPGFHDTEFSFVAIHTLVHKDLQVFVRVPVFL